jgi:hypothetical protein
LNPRPNLHAAVLPLRVTAPDRAACPNIGALFMNGGFREKGTAS